MQKKAVLALTALSTIFAVLALADGLAHGDALVAGALPESAVTINKSAAAAIDLVTIRGDKTTILTLHLDADSDLAGMTFSDDPATLVSIDQVNSGYVIRHDDNHNADVAILRGDHVDARTGGALTIDYLVNGITRSRGSFGMSLERVGDKWMIFTDRDHGHFPFSTLICELNSKPLIGVIGIKDIKAE